MVRPVVASALGLVALAIACAPTLPDNVPIVTTPRVLGVQASPPEGKPTTTTTFTALVVDDKGNVTAPKVTWEICNARNTLANLEPVSSECYVEGDSNLKPIGEGATAAAALPDIACRQFGPDVPVPVMGQPPGRPVDPDTTGGYYQPVSVFLGGVASIYRARLSCGVAGAGPDQSAQYNSRYRTNVNPEVASLAVQGGATWAADTTGKINTVKAGQKVELQVAWPDCPLVDKCGDGVCGPDERKQSCPADCTKPKGCPGAERFVNFDLVSQQVVDAREGIHVSWFATGGSFDLDRTGSSSSNDATTSDNGWTTPSQKGPAHVWVVLHDDRGGVGWAGYAVQVE
jgi:hypothetical protein